jgi:hypothetical protein
MITLTQEFNNFFLPPMLHCPTHGTKVQDLARSCWRARARLARQARATHGKKPSTLSSWHLIPGPSSLIPLKSSHHPWSSFPHSPNWNRRRRLSPFHMKCGSEWRGCSNEKFLPFLYPRQISGSQHPSMSIRLQVDKMINPPYASSDVARSRSPAYSWPTAQGGREV